MPLLRNNLGWRTCVCLALAILSLGRAAELSGQMLSSPNAPITPSKKIEGVAKWYNVPPNSLAKRRAGKDELTAAHNRLPIGTKVRVTHIANGKSVVVRITDRGITDHRSVIDLCKEAAAQLDMLREGSARVRLEVLPDDTASTKKAPVW
ncbi:MAG TPA: septal ring lytic transglycosylase RlpA family protein [Chthoniobacterales bacterium]|nr:septal ring lytic transglycosylase RlpA family protein [Chthoniobacterales bacterium]